MRENTVDRPMKTVLAILAGFFLLLAVPFIASAIAVVALGAALEKRTTRAPFVCGRGALDHELLRPSFVPKPRPEHRRQAVADVVNLAGWRGGAA
jgi:hypothetical protein